MGTRIGGVSRPQHVRSNHAADGWVVSYASIKSRLALDEMSSHSDTDSASSRLAVVIPALNERENLDLLIPAVKEVVAAIGLTIEILVVDGGSTDGTPQAATRWGARVVVQRERGYGGALLAGFADTTARDFDLLEELLIRVHAEGWQILEVPFHYMSRGTGRSHVRLFKFGVAFLKTLVRMWRLRNSVASADYDHRAFDSPIWLQRYWQRSRHRVVFGFLEDRNSVLDIGCGSGRIIQDLPDAVRMDIPRPTHRWL